MKYTGYDNGGIEGDWEPPNPPEVGTPKWKDDMALSFAIEHRLLDESQVVKLPKVNGYSLGYFVIRHYTNSGTDYFRIDNIKHYAELTDGEFDEKK